MATLLTRPEKAERVRSFLAIYRSGGLTRAECSLWAANYPDEVPLVNGEFEWIALSLADLD